MSKVFKVLMCGVFFGAGGFFSATTQDTLKYEINLDYKKDHIFEVKLQYKSNSTGTQDFEISKWTPGYYQILNFQDFVQQVTAFQDGKMVEVLKIHDNKWRIPTQSNKTIELRYQVKAESNFIAKPFINSDFAFVRPTGVYIYPVNKEDSVVLIDFKNNNWSKKASGLQNYHKGYIAQNISELLDSPILLGELKDLGSFSVKGKPHYFLGRELDDFDTQNMMNAMQKVVVEAVKMMDDIPYDFYTFMSTGKGNGGIEQTNSTALTLNGALYKTEAGKQKLLNFLTHEYFHHFNAKRIIPIELTPIDYSRENRTNMLWVAEGLTVYYEGILMNRAGLKTADQMLEEWRTKIEMFENNQGKKYQTLADSSKNTWEDGPFGIKGKTISYYEKGPLIGMLLDLKIRHNTHNKKSLDDVMRTVYWTFYKDGKRGYTEQEFRVVCESYAGENLDDIFKYVYNLEPINYAKYFELAGLDIRVEEQAGKSKVVLKRLKKLNALQTLIQNDVFRLLP